MRRAWRDAEKLIGEDGALQMVDPLCVIETCMRYFYSLAQTGRKANAPLDEVRKCFEKAAHLAALAAPYRHPRLSAVKLNKDPVDPALRKKASLEELRVQMQKHWKRLAPVLDLEALVPRLSLLAKMLYAGFVSARSVGDASRLRNCSATSGVSSFTSALTRRNPVFTGSIASSIRDVLVIDCARLSLKT